MTRFRDAKVCNNLATDEIHDHRIKSGQQCESGLQYPERKKTPHFVIACAWWNRAQHRWQTWPSRPKSTFYTTHMNIDTWNECANNSRVCPCSVFVTLECTPDRDSSFTCARHLMVITWWTYLFDLESSIPFSFFIFSFILNLLHFFLHFFPLPWGP